MAGLKDDASTDIDKKVKDFAKDMTSELVKIRKSKKAETGSGAASVPVVTFKLSTTKVSKSRTPAEQAALVVKGSTKVCWSSHMADKARHVLMKVDGKISWDAKKALGDDFETFKKKWGAVMKKHGLKNAAGKDGWPSWDQFHLELPDSKVARTNERAKSCLEEYARLTRKDSKKINSSFEKKYGKLLKSYIAKYDKEAKKKDKKAEKKPAAK